MTTTTATAHYHVRRHRDDDDVLSTSSLAEAMDYAATELDHITDQEHTMIRVLGEQGDFEGAWRCWDRVETWAGLQLNAANIHRQLTAQPADRAPLYQADDAEAHARVQVAAEHTIDSVNTHGPDGFQIWSCATPECAPADDDE